MQKNLKLSVLGLMLEETKRALPPSRERLAILLGLSLETVDDALVELEREGIVDARRARFTMIGLAFASAMRPAARRSELAA
jgi:DNA-binding transcriptional regulator YhcF (GntR family)